MTVPITVAAWLKSTDLIETVASADATRWVSQGVAVSVSSPFATEAGASAEAGRVLDLLRVPVVQDAILVVGRRSDLVGRCIDGVDGGLDYDPAGERLFVIGAKELADNTTALTVLRRLQ